MSVAPLIALALVGAWWCLALSDGTKDWTDEESDEDQPTEEADDA